MSIAHPHNTRHTCEAIHYILWHGAGAENQVKLFDEDQAINTKITYNFGRDGEQQRVVFSDHFDRE